MATINRVNGLVSGFDTETLVKDLMKLEKTKTNKVFREKQSVSWQKDAYKEVMSLFRGFQSEYLDLLKPNSNLRSKTAFNVFTAGAKIGGVDTAKVAVATSASSAQGRITIDSITTLATRDTWVSGSEVKPLEGTVDPDILTKVNASLAAGNNSVSITLDGTTKSIDLTGINGTGAAYQNIGELVSNMNSQIAATFGAGRITVSESAGALKLSATAHTVVMGEGDMGLLGKLGFAAGASNSLATTASLSSAFGVTDGTLAFSINGVSSTAMGITAGDSIKLMMEKINASAAGVTISYSSLANGFSMKAKNEGLANNINLTDTNNFFGNHLKLSDSSGRTAGKDAAFSVNGIATTRSSNSVVVDGTTIQLKDTSAVAIDIDVAPNTKAVKDNIVKFVNQYNELIDKVYGKLNEARYRDFTPLTDEEKAGMNDENIKLWESKAKSGLIKGDSLLTNLMTQLRTAFGESVSGTGISLSEMGIATSANYKEYGKLVIDESKLDTALANKLDEVTAFFTTESSHAYGDAANSSARRSENGLAARINDILNDNIRITRDGNGKRGLLVERAGNEKVSTDVSSDLAKKISELETRYSTLLDKMNDTEDRYYAKFTAMESALSKMNAQSSSLAGMLGGSSS